MRTAAALALSLTLCPATAMGQKSIQAIELRAVSGMPEELQIELARLGEPRWRTVSADKKTLASLIADECGELPPKVAAAINAEAVHLNAAKLDAKLPLGARAAIPFCLRLDTNVTVMIKADDRLEKILKENYGVYGPQTVKATVAANTNPDQPVNVETFAKTLQIGDELILPYAAQKRVFVPREPQTDVKSEIAKLTTPEMTAAIENSLAPLDISPEEIKDKYALVESVVPAGADPKDACGPDENIPYPIPTKALEEIYLFESEKWKVDFDETLRPVVIGIVDTGLEKPADDFFDDKYLAKNRAEANGVADSDDDSPNNSAIDDVYGINLNLDTPSGYVQPFPSEDTRWMYHGTKMASLLLGGPGIKEWSGLRPSIKLKIVNFASSLKPNELVSPYRLTQAIAYLVAERAKVINLSLHSDQNIAEVGLSSHENASTLFVVAAGNKKLGAGRDLKFFPVYPAVFGGRVGSNKENFITVGAHNLSGRKAEFSNHSEDYVDLYAPGCGVMTRDGAGAVVADDGTSPATAIVSHAAGLLVTLGLEKPKLIKNRILASVDYDENLKGAWSRGRLDILKTISLSRDVIQPKNKPLRFEAIDDKKQFFQACVLSDPLPDADQLFKVVPNIIDGGKVNMDLWIMVGDLLQRSRCEQRPDAAITLNSGQSLNLEDIGDIVFRWR